VISVKTDRISRESVGAMQLLTYAMQMDRHYELEEADFDLLTIIGGVVGSILGSKGRLRPWDQVKGNFLVF